MKLTRSFLFASLVLAMASLSGSLSRFAQAVAGAIDRAVGFVLASVEPSRMIPALGAPDLKYPAWALSHAPDQHGQRHEAGVSRRAADRHT